MLNDHVKLVWPSLLEAYTGKRLQADDAQLWHDELQAKVGNLTDGDICRALREWDVPETKKGLRMDLHCLASRIKQFRRKGRSEVATYKNEPSMDTLRQTILKADNCLDIWTAICTPRSCLRCISLERFAIERRGFSRRKIKDHLDKTYRSLAASLLGQSENSELVAKCSGIPSPFKTVDILPEQSKPDERVVDNRKKRRRF